MGLIEIKISTPKGIANVFSTQIQSAVSAAISSTLMVTKSKWEQVAQDRLTSTRADYILGLNADDSLTFPDAFTGILVLRGKWPNMLEQGFSAFDMKPGFANSAKRHATTNGGWYMNIPFRHLTPNATGAGVKGQPMPDDIYARAQLLLGGQRLTATQDLYPPSQSFTGYQHRAGIYEDMKKVQKTYDGATQSYYMTWRRVSDKSDPNMFWHPGYTGVHAINEVVPFAKDTFKKVYLAYLQKAMG